MNSPNTGVIHSDTFELDTGGWGGCADFTCRYFRAVCFTLTPIFSHINNLYLWSADWFPGDRQKSSAAWLDSADGHWLTAKTNKKTKQKNLTLAGNISEIPTISNPRRYLNILNGEGVLRRQWGLQTGTCCIFSVRYHI